MVPAKKWSRRIVNYSLVAVLSLMLFFLVFGEWGLVHYRRLVQERRLLEERSQALQRENELLREKIYRLRKDDRYLEKLAREELGLAREDETIYLFPAGEVKEANREDR